MSLKISYLDDEPELCENFVDLFADDRVAILTFSDIPSFVAHVHKDRPDLIFIDYRLPGTTGDKVAQSLPADIPKILITGDLSVTSDYTFTQIVTKPFDPTEIAKTLRQYLQQKS